jgi:hypothetical protein
MVKSLASPAIALGNLRADDIVTYIDKAQRT